jgi:hypothetical protein
MHKFKACITIIIGDQGQAQPCTTQLDPPSQCPTTQPNPEGDDQDLAQPHTVQQDMPRQPLTFQPNAEEEQEEHYMEEEEEAMMVLGDELMDEENSNKAKGKVTRYIWKEYLLLRRWGDIEVCFVFSITITICYEVVCTITRTYNYN